MRIRRKYLKQAKGNKAFQKCLALVVLLKVRLKNSVIPHYTTNKLCKTVGLSHKTAKKYEKLLLECGFIHFTGSIKNKVLVVNKISSDTPNRNIDITEIDCTSFFAVYNLLKQYLFMHIQHKKDLIRQLLQAKSNPKDYKEFKAANRKVKVLVKKGILRSVNVKYKEFGISLQRIANEVGCCVRTAQRIVNSTVEKGWVEKHNNFEWFYTPNIHRLEVDGFTFSTKHKLCKAHPNSYTLSPSISLSFGLPRWSA